MIGQIEPLREGTHIKTTEYGNKNNNKHDYIIKEFIAQGGSGIVYKASRISDTPHATVILKEYYPYNSSDVEVFFRKNGVIVKKGEENSPYSTRFLDVAKKEKDNNWGCSGGSDEELGEKSSKVCFIDKILCANAIEEPENEDIYESDHSTVGVFAEMDSYAHVLSYTGLVDHIREAWYKSEADSEIRKELEYLLSPDRDSLSAHGKLCLIYTILQSVNTIHKCGWVHRDLKPTNLLFESDNEIKPLDCLAILIDFGSACRLLAGTNPLHAEKGEFPYTCGTTIGYQPPEILPENEKTLSYEGWTKSSDIYQIGCIMYYLFCDSFPPQESINYEKTKIEEKINRFNLHPEVAKYIENIILKAIAFEPNNRYSDIDSYAFDILEACIQTSSSADMINNSRRIIKKAESNQKDTEDYFVIFDFANSLKNKYNYVDFTVENQSLATNEEELGNIGQVCIWYRNKRFSFESVQYGILYIESIQKMFEESKYAPVSSVVLSSIGESIYGLWGDELGIQLIRESFRFYKQEITDSHLSTYHESPVYVKACLYCSLWDTLVLEGITIINHTELIDIAENWRTTLNDSFFDSWPRLKFYHYLRVVDLYLYNMDYHKALRSIEKCEEILTNTSDEEDIKMEKPAILILRAKIYNEMHYYQKLIDVSKEYLEYCAINNIDSDNKARRLQNNALAEYYLAQAYYHMGDCDQSAEYISKAIPKYIELKPYYQHHGDKWLKSVLRCGRMIYETDIDSSNKAKLLDVISKANTVEVETVPNKTNKKYNISYDNVFKSVRLCIDSPYIPKNFRPVYVKHLKEKVLDHAISSYGVGINKEDVLAIIDSSRFKSGSNGTMFTKTGICSSYFQTKRLIKYEELESVKYLENGKIAIDFANKQYEENTLPEAKIVAAILNGETSIRF